MHKYMLCLHNASKNKKLAKLEDFMFCSKCGNEVEDGTAFCPKCGSKIGDTVSVGTSSGTTGVEKITISAEAKDYDSIESILREKIPLVNSNKKEAFILSELNEKKRKVASNQIAEKKIQKEDILALLDESFFNLGARGHVFTKNAIYERFNLFLPLIIKYSDIETVWIEKGNDKSVCVVKTTTGLEWKTQQSSYNIEEFAKMMVQLADFAKKHPEEIDSNIKTSTEEENTFNTKGNIIVSAVASIIFAWNSYVTVHNFSIRNGYFFAIIGILVNLVIMFAFSQNVMAIFKRKMDGIYGWIGWGYFAALFLFFGIIIGHVPYKDLLAETAKPVVSQIIENAYGSNMNVAKCVKVDNVYKITDHIYKATAHLDNGATLQISISDADKGNIYVEIDSY